MASAGLVSVTYSSVVCERNGGGPHEVALDHTMQHILAAGLDNGTVGAILHCGCGASVSIDGFEMSMVYDLIEIHLSEVAGGPAPRVARGDDGIEVSKALLGGGEGVIIEGFLVKKRGEWPLTFFSHEGHAVSRMEADRDRRTDCWEAELIVGHQVELTAPTRPSLIRKP